MARLVDLNSPRQAYTVGLALIAVLVTLQFFGANIAVNRQEVSSIQINLAGRQRMLSQRIAWTMTRLVENPGADPARLRGLIGVCVDLMERSHLALVARELGPMQTVLAAGGPCLTPDPAAEIRLPTDRAGLSVSSDLASFTNFAWSVATAAASAEETQQFLSGFEQPLVELLGQLDRDTLAAQEESTAQLETLLSINWLLILFLVVGELVLIFRPMAQAVERSFSRLRDANARLQQSETRLQDFASTAAHQFWETDSEYRFTWIDASEPSARLLDVSSSLGHRFWEVEGVSADDGETDWDSLRASLDAHTSFKGFDYPAVDASGKTRWWRLHGRPVYSDGGEFQGYRGTSLEITGERETERQLRLSERMRALGQLTAGVAHDFNNILAIIQGSADLIPKEVSAEGRKQSVNAIGRAVARGTSLVQRLLAFGQVQPLRASVIDLRVFLHEMEDLLQRTLGENFNVTVTLPFGVHEVLADRHQLEDACLNIALNARDAAEPGGRLWIDARKADPQKVAGLQSVGASSTDFVCISFRDNGSGMPDDVRDRIFEPFYTTKDVGQGTGLGLSMVYGFALQSSGFIDVQTVEGEGTTFELYLPLVDQASEPDEVTSQDERRFADGLSALLVEDNDTLRRVTRRHLESMGIEVVEANGGGSALEQLEYEGPFDLLILDVVLPGGIDGVEVYRQARKRDPDVKVMFCSGHVGAAGGDGESKEIPGLLLRKPYGFDQLAEALERVLIDVEGESPTYTAADHDQPRPSDTTH